MVKKKDAVMRRLYYDNPYRREFTAEVRQRLDLGGRVGIVLDQTAFYPASGGQPHDTGSLNGVRVVEVVEQDEAVVHVLGEGDASPSARSGAPALAEGTTVRGEIDWRRRFDFMQQHSGQHILSQCFLRLLGAETVSFHLGEATGTFDLALEVLNRQQVERVEELANQVVFENWPILSYFVSEEEAASIPLRRAPVKTGKLRVVEVKGFDYSACGGTHVRGAGEIGLIKVTRWERRGKNQRIEFLCGWRALADYGAKNAAVAELGALLSVSSGQVVEAARRLMAQNEERQRELERAVDRLLECEAEELARGAPEWNGVRVVRKAFSGRSIDEVRLLAAKIAVGERRVALLATSGDKAHLVFARSSDLTMSMNEVMKATCQAVGGRGGGTPQQAQGGGIDLARVEEALELAQSHLT